MTSKEALAKIKDILGFSKEAFYDGKTEQGMAIKMEGELEIGAPVYVATEEGMIPAPPGVHKLDDGTEIEVDESGKVSKIKVGDMETEEEDTIEEEKVEEEMSIEMQFGDIKLKDGTVLRLEGEEPSVGLQIKKVGYDGALSAIHDGLYETTDGKMISIVGGQIEGVQSVEDNKKRGEGFADYPWDQCMEDQMKQYGDEEIAKRVCGAIKAGNFMNMPGAPEMDLEMAKEEWVVMSGDDNYYMPLFVEEFLEAGKNHGVHFVYCNLIHNWVYNLYIALISGPKIGQIDIGNFMAKTKFAKQLKLDMTRADADGVFVEEYLRKFKGNIIKLDKFLYVHN